jgi:hypothetical protein
VRYQPDDWAWQLGLVPPFPVEFVFDDRPPEVRNAHQIPGEGYQFPDIVREGERHYELFKQIRSFKAIGIDRDATYEVVLMCNESCRPPLVVDAAFDRWFARAWDKADRPLKPDDLFGHVLEAF